MDRFVDRPTPAAEDLGLLYLPTVDTLNQPARAQMGLAHKPMPVLPPPPKIGPDLVPETTSNMSS
jgi:hypothetical protein